MEATSEQMCTGSCCKILFETEQFKFRFHCEHENNALYIYSFYTVNWQLLCSWPAIIIQSQSPNYTGSILMRVFIFGYGKFHSLSNVWVPACIFTTFHFKIYANWGHSLLPRYGLWCYRVYASSWVSFPIALVLKSLCTVDPLLLLLFSADQRLLN